MKYLFGTVKKSNENNFERFIIRSLSEDKTQEPKKLLKEGAPLEKKKTLLMWLTPASVILMCCGLMFIAPMLSLIKKNGFATAMNEKGIYFFVGISLFAAGLISFIVFKIISLRAKKDPEVKQYVAKAERTAKECEFDLGVPENALKMDVIATILRRNKNGEEVIDTLWSPVPYLNFETNVFLENDNICFADTQIVIALPLKSIIGIKTINKSISLPQWNKQESYKSKKYKSYKFAKTNTGALLSRPYHEIHFDIEGEVYCLIIPCYEKEPLLKLLGEEIPVLE